MTSLSLGVGAVVVDGGDGGGGGGGWGGGGCGFDHACREMSLVVGGDRTDFLFNLIRSLSLLPSLNHYYNNHYHSLLV